MSMMTNIGSSTAASDVMSFIEEKIKEEKYAKSKEALELAEEIRKHCEDIKQSADQGYY